MSAWYNISSKGREYVKNSFMVFALLPVALSSCASIISGTSQEVAVNTKPSGAECDVERDGKTIGHIDETPGSLVVTRANSDILVECSKTGYEHTNATNENDVEAWAFGNLFFGGLIGLAVDAFSGAINSYDNSTTVVLNPSPEQATSASPDLHGSLAQAGAKAPSR